MGHDEETFISMKLYNYEIVGMMSILFNTPKIDEVIKLSDIADKLGRIRKEKKMKSILFQTKMIQNSN